MPRKHTKEFFDIVDEAFKLDRENPYLPEMVEEGPTNTRNAYGFNPGQQRDEHGKWTRGGGVGYFSDQPPGAAFYRGPVGGRPSDIVHPKPLTGTSKRLGGGLNETELVTEAGTGDKFVFKPVEGEHFGMRSGRIDNEEAPLAEREALAWRVDDALGLGLVPETTVREVDGRVGSAQRFSTGGEGIVENIAPKEMAKMAVLDVLTGNLDRHRGNFIINDQGHLVAIDHGYTFGKTVPGDSLRSFAVGLVKKGDMSPRDQRKLATVIETTDWNHVLSGSHLDRNERVAFDRRREAVVDALREARLHTLKDEFDVSVW